MQRLLVPYKRLVPLFLPKICSRDWILIDALKPRVRILGGLGWSSMIPDPGLRGPCAISTRMEHWRLTVIFCGDDENYSGDGGD